MKNKVFLLSIVAILTGCQQGQNPHLRKTDLSILSPVQAPAVAMYNFVNGLTTVTDPQTELMPMFDTGSYDIIVAPAKGGLTKITKSGVNYQMAAVVTFGNFSLVKVNPNDEAPSAGDKVLYFQKNDIPGAVFNYLYGDLGLETYDVDKVSLTSQSLQTGTFNPSGTTIQLDYVFSSEPIITNVGKTSQIYEVASDAFVTKTGGKSIIQAGVFVNKNVSHEKVDKFLNLLEQDIAKGIANPSNIKKTLDIYGSKLEQEDMFGISGSVIVKCMKSYNGLGLGFVRAYEHRDEIDYFLNTIMNCGLELDEEVYYQ